MNFSWKYAVLIVGLVVIAYLVMNFNSRIANLRRLSVQREAVAARLEGLESTQALLQTQIARATSEAAVIEWAYQEGNLVRPGDNPVVPVPPEGSTPVPTPTPAVPRPQVQAVANVVVAICRQRRALTAIWRRAIMSGALGREELSDRSNRCGVEQWQLVGLITRRSLVRIQAPLLWKKP